MRTKILFIIGFVVVLALGIGFMTYVTQEHETFTPKNKSESEPESVVGLQPKDEVGRSTFLVKENFTLTLPPGWQEILAPEQLEILAMAVDSREKIEDEKVKEIDFQTNFSIKSDDLKKYEKEYTLQEYVAQIKTSLTQLIPDIKFTNEEEGEIQSYPAYFVECESVQEGIDFKTLLAFIKGKDDIIWAISFNTFQNSWPIYKDVFYQIAESFKTK